MKRAEIWHNPRCSKSRQTLALLQEQDVAVEVVRYLDDPPNAARIREVLAMLGRTPEELVRRGESLFKELGLSDAGDEALIRAMAEHPRLIERPVVIFDGHAALGRPPEGVLSLFSSSY
jgi:arsenate reductase (glutaredoxin)